VPRIARAGTGGQWNWSRPGGGYWRGEVCSPRLWERGEYGNALAVDARIIIAGHYLLEFEPQFTI